MEIPVRGITLRAQRVGTMGGPRWLGLHGWMDNSASLVPLALQFPEFDWVLLDHAGHGQSDHRGPGSAYHYIDYVVDVLCVADALGWDSWNIAGHSLGAGVALMCAGTAPEKVERVWAIEGLGPITTEPEDAPANLRLAAEERYVLAEGKAYPTLDDLVERRLRLNPELPRQVVTELVRRGAVEDAQGWRFSNDPRLRLASPLRLTEAQVEAFFARITAPVRFVAGTEGLRMDSHVANERLAKIAHREVFELPGGHHLHLEDPAAVAQALVR